MRCSRKLLSRSAVCSPPCVAPLARFQRDSGCCAEDDSSSQHVRPSVYTGYGQLKYAACILFTTWIANLWLEGEGSGYSRTCPKLHHFFAICGHSCYRSVSKIIMVHSCDTLQSPVMVTLSISWPCGLVQRASL